MKTILYLSPHFDDVVFSCSRHLLEQCEKGSRTVVATIFTEGGEAVRKEEDLCAMALCHAEHIWLGEVDAPFRDEYYKSFERLIFGRNRSFSLDLQPLIDEVNPDLIVAPLGVGTHIDHRLVFDAVTEFDSVLYYAEKPYSIISGALELRLNELGYEVNLPEFQTFWQSYLSASYVREYLGEQQTVVRQLLKDSFSLEKGLKEAEVVWEGIPMRRAIDAYSSQLQAFVDHEFYSARERIFELK